MHNPKLSKLTTLLIIFLIVLAAAGLAVAGLPVPETAQAAAGPGGPPLEVLPPPGHAHLQATVGYTFTYQGRLEQESGPVEGSCDLTFRLFDSLSGGSQVGGDVTNSSVVVQDGYFTQPLNFGGGMFDGSARWLEINDSLGNVLGGLPFTGGESYNVDTLAPNIVSSVRAKANPTSASSVDFTVTFSEDVTGVDSADFDLTTVGLTGAAVTGVSGSGSIYTVTVSTGSGTGSIQLIVPASATIHDSVGNALGGPAQSVSEPFYLPQFPHETLPAMISVPCAKRLRISTVIPIQPAAIVSAVLTPITTPINPLIHHKIISCGSRI